MVYSFAIIPDANGIEYHAIEYTDQDPLFRSLAVKRTLVDANQVIQDRKEFLSARNSTD